jgi:hypothetical protein
MLMILHRLFTAVHCQWSSAFFLLLSGYGIAGSRVTKFADLSEM